jgi:alpha-N-acetylglucosamine transferase
MKKTEDDKHYELIEEYANDHSISKGGNIEVKITAHNTSITPINVRDAMRYEDVCYLHDQINGATNFLYWLRRKGYKITKEKKNVI